MNPLENQMKRATFAWLVVLALVQWGCSGVDDDNARGQNTGGGGQNTSGGGQNTSGGGQNTSGGGQNTSAGGQNTGGSGQNTSGGGQNTGGGDQNKGGAPQARRICAADCGWLSKCDKGGKDAFCAGGECEARLEPVKWRPGFADAVAECFDGLACTESNDDMCSFTAILAIDPSFPKRAVYQGCLAKEKQCPRALPDDACFSLGAVTDAARAEAEKCNAIPCDQIAACFEAALGAPR